MFTDSKTSVWLWPKTDLPSSTHCCPKQEAGTWGKKDRELASGRVRECVFIERVFHKPPKKRISSQFANEIGLVTQHVCTMCISPRIRDSLTFHQKGTDFLLEDRVCIEMQCIQYHHQLWGPRLLRVWVNLNCFFNDDSKWNRSGRGSLSTTTS